MPIFKWLIAAFALLQAMIFTLTLLGHQSGAATNESLSTTVPYALSKASMSLFLYNLAVLFIPVCLSFVWMVRRAFGPIMEPEDGIFLHELIIWAMAAFAHVHTVSQWILYAQSAVHLGLGVKGFALAAFGTGCGWSGHAMLLMLIFTLASTKSFNKMYQLRTLSQWRTGFMSAFLILGALHGAFGVPMPNLSTFTSTSNLFWKMWIASGALCLIEKVFLGMRPKQMVKISKAIQHPNDVVEIQFLKERFRATVGQYILLCCPHVSLTEARPYALTNAPEEDFLSVHIQCNDEYTRRLAASLGYIIRRDLTAKALAPSTAVGFEQKLAPVLNMEPSDRQVLPQVFLSNPFGGLSESMFDYEVAILVGSGSGVTPFASILKSIWYRMNNPHQRARLNKVYFFWICHEFKAFEWFRSLLMAIEFQDMKNHIEVYLYLTAPIDDADATKMMINSTVNGEDVVTGLRCPSRYEKPDWADIFQDIRQIHAPIAIPVMFSGNAVLGTELENACEQGSDPDFMLLWREVEK